MRIKANTSLRFVLSVLLTFMIWSCNRMPYYAQYVNLERQTWDSHDTLRFELHEADTTVLQHLSLGVRATGAYEYRKLNVGIEVFDKGKVCHKDVLSYELYDADGERKGDGTIYSENERYVCPLQIKKGHTYTFKVYHLMRLDPLVGISNVFIQISDEQAE